MRQHLARLVYKEDGRPPVVIDIDDEIVIKRSPERYSVVCERGAECFSLDMFDPSVSGGKGHARIFWEKDKVYIQDLGSSNGTYLLVDSEEVPLGGWSSGRQMKPQPSDKVLINKTQRILLGSMEFTVELETIQNLQVKGDYFAEGASKISIRDSVIQRSVIGSGGLKGNVFSGKRTANVEIQDSVIIRSNVGNDEKVRCENCGVEIKLDVGVCPICGKELRKDVDNITWG